MPRFSNKRLDSAATPLHRRPLFRFLAYVRPHLGELTLATLTGMAKYNLPVIFPWLMKEYVDSVVAGRPTSLGISPDALMMWALVLFGAFGIVVYFRTYLADRLAQKVIMEVRADLFRHLMRLPMTFYNRQQVGMLLSRIVTDAMMAQNFIAVSGINFFMEISSVIAIAFMIWTMNAKLALVTLASLPLYVVMHKTWGSRIRKKTLIVRREMEQLEGGLLQSLQGIGETKSYTQEDREAERFSQRCDQVKQAAFSRINANASLLGGTALLTRIPTVIVIWYGGYLVSRDQMTVGTLLAFFAYLELIYNPLTRLSDLNVVLSNSLAAIERLFELFDQPAEPQQTMGNSLNVRQGRIKFDQVNFGYETTAGGCRAVLRDFQLDILPGESVAIIGHSGAGKSTLIKLLMRFYEPQSGRILIDGQSIAGVDLGSLRSQLTVVHQDVFLFDGTIAENIRFGNARATHDEVERAARAANALEFIEALPEQWNTRVGERGSLLSGGQKQRLALARAFLENAKILIFDESTSNLDANSERQVCEAVDRLKAGRTTLIISHRAAAIRGVDRVIEIENGQASEITSFEPEYERGAVAPR